MGCAIRKNLIDPLVLCVSFSKVLALAVRVLDLCSSCVPACSCRCLGARGCRRPGNARGTGSRQKKALALVAPAPVSLPGNHGDVVLQHIIPTAFMVVLPARMAEPQRRVAGKG